MGKIHISVCQAEKLVQCPMGRHGPHLRFNPNVALFSQTSPMSNAVSCGNQKKVLCKAECKGLTAVEAQKLHSLGATCISTMLEKPACFRGGKLTSAHCEEATAQCT